MKITDKFKIFAISMLTAGAMASCDDIDSTNRFIDMPQIESERVVILEDFTGQRCKNCPDGHSKIADLLAKYPDNLIAVAIHSGGDAWSYAEDNTLGIVGLRNEEGNNYGEANGILSYPTAIINRRSGLLNNPSQWETAVIAELNRPATVDLALSAKFNADSTSIEITTQIDPHANLAGRLQLWVIENSIIARQLMGDGKWNREYEHNHIFRGSVNGHDGENISLVIREQAQLSHSIDVRDIWNPRNLQIVGFIVSADGVEQATVSPVE